MTKDCRKALALSALISHLRPDASSTLVYQIIEEALEIEHKGLAAEVLATLATKLNTWRRP